VTLQSTGAASRLALGTVQFGQPYGIANARGRVGEEEVRQILDCAREAGIDTLDTAVVYGDAERTLGRIGVAGFRVISKVPAVAQETGPVDVWLLQQIEASLGRLGIGRLYGLMLHHPDDLLGPHGPAIVTGLREAVARGWVGKIGVSVYTPQQLATLVDRMPLELVQIPANVFDRRFADSGWLARLAQGGVEVHARSAFLQGLLLMPLADVPPAFAPWLPVLAAWHDWLAERGVGAVEACLSHLRSYPEIERCVVGCDGLDQLREIVACSSALPLRAPASLDVDDPALLNPALWKKR
jgi:hypothetical protein